MHFGPKDQPDQCNARLFLGDDHGDNSCTFRCQLPPEHKGQHREKFKRQYSSGGRVSITWAKDERVICEHHGIQPSDDCDLCSEAPVRCSKHGLQTSTMCFQCSENRFECPDHGLSNNNYCCWEYGCSHSYETDCWTKVLNTSVKKDA